jgi:hypothetical protein
MKIITVVQIVLVTLKAIGLIEWSWLLVLIPLWLNLGLTALILLINKILKAIHENKMKNDPFYRCNYILNQLKNIR